jgi:LmbE family N-acetylglucosaminyl deacetylase
MLHLPVEARGRPLRVLAVGAHCDDIEIGAGGLLLRLVEEQPDVSLAFLVLTSTPIREAETRASLAAWAAPAVPELIVKSLPDSRLPAHFNDVKDTLADFSRRPADIVISPHAHDAHQDHALVGQLVPTAFRDHVILAYEIPKWDGDLGRSSPQTYVKLERRHVDRKWELLDEYYKSQRQQDWWTHETFAALARLRGVECRSAYAEAFHVNKLVLSW